MEYKEIFSDKEIEDNEKVFIDLVDFIKSGDAILMAGAGCSASLYPTWTELISKLEEQAKKIDKGFDENKNELLKFADKVKQLIGEERYYAFIANTFRTNPEKTHELFHRQLCSLPFKAITTTNYDTVLENALIGLGCQHQSIHFESGVNNIILNFLKSLNYSKRKEKYVVHLHGKFDHKDSIVLSESEYTNKYGFELIENKDTLYDRIRNSELTPELLDALLTKYGYHWPIRRKLLWALLATRKIVFIGFSMEDEYFQKMLSYIQKDLHTYEGDTHYLITRITKENKQKTTAKVNKLREEYGIITYFYLDDEGSYSGLSDFIAKLELEVNKQENIPEIIKNTVSTISSTPNDLTAKLFALASKKYTDEDED